MISALSLWRTIEFELGSVIKNNFTEEASERDCDYRRAQISTDTLPFAHMATLAAAAAAAAAAIALIARQSSRW